MNLNNIVYLITPDTILKVINTPAQYANTKINGSLQTHKLSYSPVIQAYIVSSNVSILEYKNRYTIIQTFIKNIAASVSLDEARYYLAHNALFYIFLILISNSRDTLELYVNESMPQKHTIKGAYKNLYTDSMIELFRYSIVAFIENVRLDWHLGLLDQTYSHKFIRELCSIYKDTEVHLQNTCNHIHKKSLVDLGLIRSYFSYSLKCNINLVSYFETSSKIFRLAQNLRHPRLNLIEKDRTPSNKIITNIQLENLIAHVNISQFKDLMNGFFVAVYRNSMPTDYYLKNIRVIVDIPVPSSKILFRQIVAMHMKNWDKLWYYNNWCRIPEIIKRLNYIYNYHKDLLIEEETWAKLLFNDQNV